ncbi:hypothetical protein BDN70DRAFT_902254, partial [Pholiota conissans]
QGQAENYKEGGRGEDKRDEGDSPELSSSSRPPLPIRPRLTNCPLSIARSLFIRPPLTRSLARCSLACHRPARLSDLSLLSRPLVARPCIPRSPPSPRSSAYSLPPPPSEKNEEGEEDEKTRRGERGRGERGRGYDPSSPTFTCPPSTSLVHPSRSPSSSTRPTPFRSTSSVVHPSLLHIVRRPVVRHPLLGFVRRPLSASGRKNEDGGSARDLFLPTAPYPLIPALIHPSSATRPPSVHRRRRCPSILPRFIVVAIVIHPPVVVVVHPPVIVTFHSPVVVADRSFSLRSCRRGRHAEGGREKPQAVAERAGHIPRRRGAAHGEERKGRERW